MIVDDSVSEALAAGEATADPEPPETPEPAGDLELARELVLKAHPDTVQELIQGTSLAELLASVPAAQAAYARIATVAHEAATREAAAVPGGAAVRTAGVNVEALGPLAKIRAGVGQVRD